MSDWLSGWYWLSDMLIGWVYFCPGFLRPYKKYKLETWHVSRLVHVVYAHTICVLNWITQNSKIYILNFCKNFEIQF